MTYENFIFDEGFPAEYAYWEANKVALFEQHPCKYLVIRARTSRWS